MDQVKGVWLMDAQSKIQAIKMLKLKINEANF